MSATPSQRGDARWPWGWLLVGAALLLLAACALGSCGLVAALGWARAVAREAPATARPLPRTATWAGRV
ncbi:MAG: hypothetical protein GXO37_05795, partial [Chloroflexi bacterium]|nr:hypothetical protein [Chloroflexota bacterium]